MLGGFIEFCCTYSKVKEYYLSSRNDDCVDLVVCCHPEFFRVIRLDFKGDTVTVYPDTPNVDVLDDFGKKFFVLSDVLKALVRHTLTSKGVLSKFLDTAIPPNPQVKESIVRHQENGYVELIVEYCNSLFNLIEMDFENDEIKVYHPFAEGQQERAYAASVYSLKQVLSVMFKDDLGLIKMTKR